jgi:hypothetical protein
MQRTCATYAERVLHIQRRLSQPMAGIARKGNNILRVRFILQRECAIPSRGRYVLNIGKVRVLRLGSEIEKQVEQNLDLVLFGSDF